MRHIRYHLISTLFFIAAIVLGETSSYAQIKKASKAHEAYEKALERKDTTTAIKHLSKLLTLYPPTLWEEKDSLFLEDAMKLQELYSATSQQEKGINIIRNISPEIERIYGSESTEYGYCLFKFALENAKLWRWQEAISPMEAAREIYKKHNGDDSDEYIVMSLYCGDIYSSLFNYIESSKFYTAALISEEYGDYAKSKINNLEEKSNSVGKQALDKMLEHLKDTCFVNKVDSLAKVCYELDRVTFVKPEKPSAFYDWAATTMYYAEKKATREGDALSAAICAKYVLNVINDTFNDNARQYYYVSERFDSYCKLLGADQFELEERINSMDPAQSQKLSTEEEKIPDDYLDRIPKRKHNISEFRYIVQRNDDESCNSNFNLQLDYPTGDSPADMRIRDYIACNLYDFAKTNDITKTSYIYSPTKDASDIANHYGLNFLNKINEFIPAFRTDSTGITASYLCYRIAESERFQTYNEYNYFWDEFSISSILAHPTHSDRYFTVDKITGKIIGFDDIFNADYEYEVKDILTRHLVGQYHLRDEEVTTREEMFASIADILYFNETVKALAEENFEYKPPLPEIKDFPICDVSLLKEGVLFSYPKYVITYGYQNEIAAILPYEEISKYLNPELADAICSVKYLDTIPDNAVPVDPVSNQALTYIGSNKYEEALSCLNNYDQSYQRDKVKAAVYEHIGNRLAAIELYEELLSPLDSTSINEHRTDALKLANLLQENGDSDFFEHIFATGTTINSLASIEEQRYLLMKMLSIEDDIEVRLDLANGIYQIDSLLSDGDCFSQLNYHNLKSLIYEEAGRYSEAIIEYEQQINMLKALDVNVVYPLSTYGMGNVRIWSDKIYSLEKNIGKCYEQIHEYDKAIEHLLEGRRMLIGKDETLAISDLDWLARLYSLNGDTNRTIEVVNENSNNVTDVFTRLAKTQMPDKREALFELCSSWLLETLPYVALKNGSDSLKASLFTSAMVGKNIKLSAERNLMDILMKSGDDAIIERYQHLVSLQREIDRELDKETPNQWQIDSLKRLYFMGNTELSQLSSDFGDYLKECNLTSNDILAMLGKRETAIEFIRFRNDNRISYFASLLSHKLPESILVHLFDVPENTQEKQLTIFEAYEKVWSKITPYIENKSTVYFSPAGVLSISPIEYPTTDLPYTLVRVSSTSYISEIKGRTTSRHRKSALFGGLNYDSAVVDPQFDVDCDEELPQRDVKELRSREFKYLPGTLDEVTSISSLLKKEKSNVSLYTNDEGTETLFKSLSGNYLDMLHVATHGFYLSREDAEITNEKLSINDEDSDLSRSGLILSGANTRLAYSTGGLIDDGILTSKEISRLDFTGIQMVVLSACQTGLGEIYKDGVAGLQRGFKKAGVKSMIVSLWKVDDEATNLLMNWFYKNINKGMKYRDALHSAQKSLLTYDNGKYSNFRYWAGWIVID